MDASIQYRFGRCVVDAGRRQLLVDGQPAKLGARAFDLLVALIERRSKVVSKEELLDLVWPDVSVEEGNLQVQVAALRKLVGPAAIVTSAGRGYQFVATLEDAPPKQTLPAAAVPLAEASAARSSFKPRVAFAAVALVAVALLLAAVVALRAPRVLPSGTPTMAAMSFVNVGGDPLSAQIAQGIDADIATDFSRFRGVDVIAGAVTASYGRADLDARKVAKDLKVQYVLTGAVQRQGDAVQVSAQLTDGASGASLWSNRWDGSAGGDILAFQADIADSVASTLGSRNFFALQAIGPARAKPLEERTAYDSFALGYAEYLKGTADGFAASKRHFDEAIAKDPRLTLAIVQRGWASILYALVTGGDWTAANGDAERFARQTIAVDPLEAEAHILLAGESGNMGNLAEARAEVERGLKLNPTSADILIKAAMNMSPLGQPERGAELCDRALHLNSMPVVWYSIHCLDSYYFVDRYRDSLEMIRRADAFLNGSRSPWRMAYQLADETELGDRDAAAATLAEIKRLRPGFTVEGMFGGGFVRAHEIDKLVETMQKANAPICLAPDKADALPKPMHIAYCDAQRAQQAAR